MTEENFQEDKNITDANIEQRMTTDLHQGQDAWTLEGMNSSSKWTRRVPGTRPVYNISGEIFLEDKNLTDDSIVKRMTNYLYRGQDASTVKGMISNYSMWTWDDLGSTNAYNTSGENFQEEKNLTDTNIASIITDTNIASIRTKNYVHQDATWTVEGMISNYSIWTWDGLGTTDAYNMSGDNFSDQGNNLTHYVNNISSSGHAGSNASSGATPLWMFVFDDVQVTCTLLGALTNLLTIITLFLNHSGFSRVILALLRHQAIVDFCVCSMASTLILQPSRWLSGFYYLDVVICYAWHSQALYWGGVTASTCNLVLVAYERYLAVCKPFRHAEISGWPRTNFVRVLVTVYVLTLIITHGCYIQMRLTPSGCLNEYAFSGPWVDTYFFFFIIYTYLTTYFVPALLMAICYGIVIRQLKRRESDSSLGRSKQIDRANDQLTKTAIAVTLVFVSTLGYDLHYYLLSCTGLVVYKLNSPMQKVGVFLSNINSSATPFVYAAVMPIFRRSVTRTLRCRRKGAEREFQRATAAAASGARAGSTVRGNLGRGDSVDSWQSSQSNVTSRGSDHSVTISVIELEAGVATKL